MPITDEREVRMRNEDGTTSEPFKYEIETPNTIEEAIDMFGEDGTLSIFISGLKVKQDNVARNAFRSGKSVEEVEKIVANWKPGGARMSKRTIATNYIFQHKDVLNANVDLQDKIQKAFLAQDWDAVIAYFEEEEAAV